MGTFAELKARVLDEVGEGVSVRLIGQHIVRAIDHHGRERFWFNTDKGVTTTVAGAAQVALPARLRSEDLVFLMIGSSLSCLTKRSPAEIEEMGQASGQPTDYAIVDDEARLYPAPNAAYSLTFTGIYDEPGLVGDASSNAWTTEAADLIAARAKLTLYRDILRDAEGAAAAAVAEADALWRLRSETSMKLGTGRMRASA